MSAAVTENTSRAPSRWIDPATLTRISSLELRARAVVEGLFSGLHRSPYHGFSVEFSEYRQYAAGDDLRHLDWKLFARTDRLFVKRFEDETNVRCLILLDSSRSMSYGSLSYSKYEYGKTLAATLAYFLQQQRDAIGVLRFAVKGDSEYLPPRHRPGQLQRLLEILDRPAEGAESSLADALDRAAELVRRRSVFVVISDLLTPLDDLDSRLGFLRANGSEVTLMKLEDPAERDFSFAEASVFVDAETGRELHIDPTQARAGYLRARAAHDARIEDCCNRRGVDLQRVVTDEPLELVLFNWLQARAGVRGGSRLGKLGAVT